ncbi:MAG: [protein-PII] uridylyltransferase [Nitriliruptorales bacterium]
MTLEGRAWCRAWTAEVDAALEQHHDEVSLPRGRLAVAAVGGYGRRELCPGSDVDVLRLVEGLSEEAQAEVVRSIIYPLWDAGLTVGHAIRDHRQAVASAVGDIDIATALLDARLVAGDPELLRECRASLLTRLRRRPHRFLSSLAEADAARRARYGDAAEVLEPHVKEGAGGLRDVQSLRWAAAALLGEPHLDPLVGARYLSAVDRSRLARAEDFLLAVRVALHLEAGRGTDVLEFGRQEAVATRLGYAVDGEPAPVTRARPDTPPADALLHDLFLAARTVDHVHRSAWALLSADARGGRRLRRPAQRRLPGGFAVADGVLRVDEDAVNEPMFPIRLLESLVETGAALDRGSAALISRTVEDANSQVGAGSADGDSSTLWRWDGAARRRFLTTLWRGLSALDALAELDDLGVLIRLLPEWAPLRGRPQRNPYHRYSLDRHAFHAAANLAELVRSEEWAAKRLEQVTDRDGLMLGALLHDVGKAHGEPHTETGVPVADAILRRMGVPEQTRDLVARLVRLHLLLPEVATRRDLADPGLAAEVASKVGDLQTLACLHLLAAADGAATGPAAWGSWKAALVATLAKKVEAVLDATSPDEMADGAPATAREAQRLAPSLGVDAATVSAHLARLPERYAGSVSARAVIRHAAACAEPLMPTEVRTRVSPGSPEGGLLDDLDVVALDRPGLFAKVAGVIAIHGGSILSAHAFTRVDGIAVDTFTVRRPDGTGGSWWVAVEGDLVEAVAGRLAVRARVARKAAALRPPPRPLPAIPVRVEVSPDSAGEATVVEVHAEDAIGVLHRIAAALGELELDIVAAKVDTLGRKVVDVFYVRDAGRAPLDDDHAAEVVLAVTAALEG